MWFGSSYYHNTIKLELECIQIGERPPRLSRWSIERFAPNIRLIFMCATSNVLHETRSNNIRSQYYNE